MFPAKKGRSNSIKCSKNSGPEFGMHELKAYWQPFNGKRACKSWSWSIDPTYNIGVDSQGRNLLTNQLSEDASGDKVC